jgi:hypothetical protein
MNALGQQATPSSTVSREPGHVAQASLGWPQHTAQQLFQSETTEPPHTQELRSNQPAESSQAVSLLEKRVAQLEALLSAKHTGHADPRPDDDLEDLFNLDSVVPSETDEKKPAPGISIPNPCVLLWGGPTMPSDDQNLWSQPHPPTVAAAARLPVSRPPRRTAPPTRRAAVAAAGFARCAPSR